MSDLDKLFYKDIAGEWRWRVEADNGEIIGASTEGYVRKVDAMKNLITLRNKLNSLSDQEG